MTREEQIEIVAKVLARKAALDHKLPYPNKYAQFVWSYFAHEAQNHVEALYLENVT